GEIEEAIAAWQRAGEIAVARSAYREAEQHYRKALELLPVLPESAERDSRELSLHLTLGGILTTTQGWSSARTAEVYQRAKTLSEREGSAESFQVFSGLWSTAFTRAELQKALALAEQVLEIAYAMASPRVLVTANFEYGVTQLFLGNLTLARQHLLRA